MDLACGQNPREGFEGVDIWDGAAIVHDLSKYPWPFEDNSILELHSSHFIEHIPMAYVDEYGNPLAHGGQDAFFKFFDECYRILVPDGWLYVIAPSARSNRGYQDPTHRRFIVGETFYYLNAEWRKSQKLDHYNVKCNFEPQPNVTCDSTLNLLHPEAHARHLNQYWNTTIDWHCKLRAIK